jgi:hypothetical protein
MRRLVLLIVAASVFCGCSWSRQRVNVEGFHTKVNAVKVGQTKAADLKGIFGTEPNAVIPAKEGRIHLYNFGDAKTKGFNLILVSFSKTNAGLDSALFFVDENGVVQNKIVSSNSSDLDWQYWPFGGE